MPSFIEIEARKAQREAEHIRLQQEEEADLREQERLEKEEEERLAKEAEEARLEEVRRQEEAREIVRRRKAQKEAEARAGAEEASSDEVGSVSGTIHIRRKRVMVVGELDMSRKVVGMDGSEWFLKIGVSCLRCKKQGEVCYWPLELKRPDVACHRCKGMKLACRVEEESQSEVPTKKARVAKGKGKARATPKIKSWGLSHFLAVSMSRYGYWLKKRVTPMRYFLISVPTSPKIQNLSGMLKTYFS